MDDQQSAPGTRRVSHESVFLAELRAVVADLPVTPVSDIEPTIAVMSRGGISQSASNSSTAMRASGHNACYRDRKR